MLTDYLNRIRALERSAGVSEGSFYSSLEELVARCAAASARRQVRVVTLPRGTAASIPDFQVWRGRHQVVGYIEAKRPGTDLDAAERTEQVMRYRRAFPNLLLTDFREFRLYRGEEQIGAARINARSGPQLEAVGQVENEDEVLALLGLFLDFTVPAAKSARSLAVALAGRTRLLEAGIEALLARDLAAGARSDLAGFYRAFSEYLIAGLTPRQFADLYAQTLAYGLLAARWRVNGAFDRASAAEDIPRANGILRDVFRYISLAAPPPDLEWILDDIVDLLAAAPVRGILEQPPAAGEREPILHFYETFLARYDPDLRRRRGVYYTPQPVVSYIVRSVDRLLREKLGWPEGLAAPEAKLLDPAAGTLTFLVEAFRVAADAHAAAYGDGGVPALLRDRLLPNAFAFELMMAPYAIGHLKMGLFLASLGCPLDVGDQGDRVQLLLTDALDHTELEQTALPGMSALSRESHEAGRVKREQKISVVLGNPPWFGHSASRDRFIDRLLKEGYTAADGRRDEGYYRLDGRPLGERNPKWLQDDYVKFLRFAQWKIDQNGRGVVGMVTNHGFLDNPTFSGMRASLMATFDEIYVLDLHGYGWKEEEPGGPRDANVFAGVGRGVAILLLVKQPGLPKRVLRADLRDGRAGKFDWLLGHDAATTDWTELAPARPSRLFVAGEHGLEKEYERGVALPAIFPRHSAGILTARDAFATDFNCSALKTRIQLLRNGTHPEDLRPGRGRGLVDTGTWQLAEARRRAIADDRLEDRFTALLYRPFDLRILFYADYVVERPRRNVMGHLLAGGNLALIVPRQCKKGPAALVTDRLAGHKAASAFDVNYVFPLHLFPAAGETGNLLPGAAPVPNLPPQLLASLAAAHGASLTAEEVLSYVYAVLYARTYRRRYDALLRRDFPRIPLAADRRLFHSLAALGAELIDLHLLRAPCLDAPGVRLHGEGRPPLGRRGDKLCAYRPAEERLYLNGGARYFEGIPPEVWAYRIGGHPVLDRWLRARAERVLSHDEIRHFCRTAAALRHTLEIERRIDALYLTLGEVVELGPGT
jgi:type ISP restriction-modification system protein/N-6 DNA methylase